MVNHEKGFPLVGTKIVEGVTATDYVPMNINVLYVCKQLFHTICILSLDNGYTHLCIKCFESNNMDEFELDKHDNVSFSPEIMSHSTRSPTDTHKLAKEMFDSD